ncbi:hypothetical protein JRO89_XS05G0018200 [Xanthoceras sorbifolium]|nr:hypothetical protein JRO89_XS05G0018200 [Xanthoceras sorbifolium]
MLEGQKRSFIRKKWQSHKRKQLPSRVCEEIEDGTTFDLGFFYVRNLLALIGSLDDRFRERLNDLMESKGGKKSSSSKSLFYEAPLGYSIEDVRPNGGIKKFRSAAYSNCARKPS